MLTRKTLLVLLYVTSPELIYLKTVRTAGIFEGSWTEMVGLQEGPSEEEGKVRSSELLSGVAYVHVHWLKRREGEGRANLLSWNKSAPEQKIL